MSEFFDITFAQRVVGIGIGFLLAQAVALAVGEWTKRKRRRVAARCLIAALEKNEGLIRILRGTFDNDCVPTFPMDTVVLNQATPLAFELLSPECYQEVYEARYHVEHLDEKLDGIRAARDDVGFELVDLCKEYLPQVEKALESALSLLRRSLGRKTSKVQAVKKLARA